MPTNNAERAGFSVSLNNDAEKVPCKLRIMTLERVYRIIESKNYDAKVTSELKKSASKYPQQALENFMQNFDKHLLRARKAVRLSSPTVSPVDDSIETKNKEEEIPNAPQETEF